MLSCVYTGLERGRPTGGVDTRSSVPGALDRLPIHKKSNGVLSLRYAIVRFTSGNPRGGAGDYTGWNGDVLKDPTADIDVVR